MGHNITGNAGPVNIASGNMSVQHAAKSQAEIDMERRNAEEERKMERLRMEAEMQQEKAEMEMERRNAEEERRMERIRMEAQLRREMQERADAERAAQRRKHGTSVGVGATIGFFCAGPLGAAIGAKLGSNHHAQQQRG